MIIQRDTKDRFYVIVYCKPQVRKFIYTQCGDPADLSFLPQVHNTFHQLLQITRLEDKISEDRQRRGDLRYDKFCRVSQDEPPYPDTMNVCINKKQFYRNGFYLNARGVILFNKFVDAYIKDRAVMYVQSQVDITGNICEAIRQFQDSMNFTEEELSLECIRKHMQRQKVKFYPEKKTSFIQFFNTNFETNIEKKHTLKRKSSENL